MAVNFATPPSALHQHNMMPPHNYSTMNNPSEISRQNSPFSLAGATPLNSSPTSPQNTTSASPITQNRVSCYTRQLRPPKAPLYVPAVLRPTERPAKYCRQESSSTSSGTTAGSPNSLITPPATRGASFESKDEDGILRRVFGDDIARAGITRIVTDEWNEDLFERMVTGEPTRDHWKLDVLSSICDNSTCNTTFTFFTRRHHCRRCGKIFCGSHSTHTVALDQHARFHPLGLAGQRACDSCYSDYVAWRKARRARRERGSSSTEGSGRASLNSSAGGGSGSSGSVTPRPIVEGQEDAIQEEDEGEEEEGEGGKVKRAHIKKKMQEVGSVPRDWNWSTF